MTTNDSKSYLSYVNKLVDEYNNTYHLLLVENLLMLIILLSLKKLSQVKKSGLLSTRIALAKVTLKIGLEKYLLLLCVKR